MSVKTTHTIERDTAESVIIYNINTIGDDELSNMLECIENKSTFRNYIISEQDTDEFPMPHIQTLFDF